MRKRNLRLLIILTLVSAPVAGTVHLPHELQVARNARLLLVLADRREADGQLREAAGTLARYAELVPTDTEALARLGLLNAKTGNHFGAFAVLELVLRRQPGINDVRREIVEVA